jgi:hypothetical protein
MAALRSLAHAFCGLGSADELKGLDAHNGNSAEIALLGAISFPCLILDMI